MLNRAENNDDNGCLLHLLFTNDNIVLILKKISNWISSSVIFMIQFYRIRQIDCSSKHYQIIMIESRMNTALNVKKSSQWKKKNNIFFILESFIQSEIWLWWQLYYMGLVQLCIVALILVMLSIDSIKIHSIGIAGIRCATMEYQ